MNLRSATRLKTISRIITLVFILILLLPQNSFAKPSPENQSYSEVKKEFQRLRNTDSHIHRESDWNNSIDLLKNFYDKLSPEQSAESMFLVGQGYITLWKQKNEKQYFNSAVDAFKVIVKDKSDTSKAAASLHELYKLYISTDNDLAEDYLEKIIEFYPKSEYSVFAAEKLKQGNQTSSQEKRVPAKEDVFKVVLDPGHGGEDFGAVGVGGIFEKDIVLEIAYSIKAELEKDDNFSALLTRTSDQFVPLQQRTEFANDSQADLFVSIHCNASEKKNLSGFESFILDEKGDSAALQLAQRENASSEGGNGQITDDVAIMLSELIQATKKPESISLANILTNSIKSELATNEDFKSLSVKKPRNAPFYVLVGAHMPAVLLELSYVDNEFDGPLLASRDFRNTLVAGLVSGIKVYRAKHVVRNN